ncbi:MAG: gluconate 2-dehydrogenase subunit 3 family protein [Bradyrhizobium sp.]|nr:gluconate 2-dehydrogenase subunit 3 family protein [Pseudomonadota bacterium]MDE2067664.1 gluconate 2-dehydrogenase subunit 3 family protein [Bradyrhizobium sp.]MDE2241779.1 gluconate 2-dehydrogenase subunit 3 family protein [Bradyrhizobium sp.]MDE2469996.1 gluconate 2-dehydrogenase subunit 3 family protein [Bradyrhizobium sp.]
MHRRSFLISAALWFAGTTSLTRASTIHEHMPWSPYPSDAPRLERPGPWQFFTADEANAIEAIVDRIIPPDPQTPGGKEAGCAVFIDRQLKGPYGSGVGHYNLGPYKKGTKEQGPQSPLTPAKLYRQGLASLDEYCKSNAGGKTFAQLSADQQDDVLKKIEAGQIKFDGVDAQGFFDALLKDVPEGFFSDPIHGGNRNMVGWSMIGFPGIRYDYRDWVHHHNERYPYPPVSIAGRVDWTPHSS